MFGFLECRLPHVIRLIGIDTGENEIKDLAVPCYRFTFNTFLDILVFLFVKKLALSLRLNKGTKRDQNIPLATQSNH
jgi:hypothetical protein